MKFTPLPLAGAWLIEAEPIADERGFFTRLIDRETFSEHGLETFLDQSSMSRNFRRGTLRGMHWQVEPYAEIKLVRVTAGSIHDVIIDLRATSPTFLASYAVILTARQPAILYVPAGFAHGFQTLEDDTEVSYQMNLPFHAPAARGFAWNDPQFAIPWPIANPTLSTKDAAATLFHESMLAPL